MTQAALQPLTLSVKDLAHHLRLKEGTVRKMNAGELLPEPITVGNSKRWLTTEIEEWLSKGCPDREEWTKLRESRPARRMKMKLV